MPTFTLDGKPIPFEPGQTIIQAAANAGVTIPHFCWHPALSVSGNCRVCLVEVEKMPKLVIACSTQAAEGMVVHSATEKTLTARKSVMEFILINHPLDCPICDEAGECKLQEYAYSHSAGESRFSETKNHKEKRVPLGPRVMFDAERCISCSRCIRFCDEIAGKKELTFVQRGDRVTIAAFPGKQLENPYSMNVVDICPVGALTSRDFRFKARVWDMSSTKSVCPGCARGCNIDVWVKANRILRLTPRNNPDVNAYWMCDDGRLNSWKGLDGETRVNGAFIKRDGKQTPVTWDEAYAYAGSELKGFSRDEIAFIGSPFASTEDNYLFVKFAKSVFGARNVDFIRHEIPGAGDDLLIREDKAPNALGARLAGVTPGGPANGIDSILQGVKEGRIRALYLLEDDLVEAYPWIEPYLSKLDFLAVHAVRFNKTTPFANVLFAAASFAEKHGAFVNFQGRVQRLRPAVTTPEHDRSLDGLAQSRLDKFGVEFDKWGRAPKVDARSSWKIVNSVWNTFGVRHKFAMAEEVFADLAEHAPAFKNIDYDAIGEAGIAAGGGA